MDTSNKIRVVEQNERSMKRTDSGGVRDPSDPKHYPPLGGTEGAVVQAASPQRRLSSITSFKDSLLSMPAPDNCQVASDGSSGSMASLTGPRSAKADNAIFPASSSPRILAERPTPSLIGAGTADPDLITGPSQQVSQIFDTILVFLLSCIDCCTAHWPLPKSDSSHPILLPLSSSALQVAARQNIQEDDFAPPSPRKVSQATHRRRTADEQATRELFYKKVANGNTFAPLAEDAAQDESQESSAEVGSNEASVPDVDANAHKR